MALETEIIIQVDLVVLKIDIFDTASSFNRSDGISFSVSKALNASGSVFKRRSCQS